MITAAAIRKMVDLGLNAEQIAELCESLAPAKSAGAERQARYRARKAGRDVTSDVTRDASLCDERVSPKEPPHTPIEITPSQSGGGVGCARGAVDDWPSGNLVFALVETIGSPKLDPAKSPGLITTAGRLTAWRREGASWQHDVIPVVTGLCLGKREQVTTWKFFDAAIARSIADNRQALQIPEATGLHRGQGPPGLVDRIAAEHAEARRRVLENG